MPVPGTRNDENGIMTVAGRRGVLVISGPAEGASALAGRRELCAPSRRIFGVGRNKSSQFRQSGLAADLGRETVPELRGLVPAYKLHILLLEDKSQLEPEVRAVYSHDW